MRKMYDLMTIKAIPNAILQHKQDQVEYKIQILLFISVNLYDQAQIDHVREICN